MNAELVWHKISDACYNIDSFVQKNSVRTVMVQGREYCIGHFEDGLFALYDTCPHAGASLGHGFCNDKGVVTCPQHNYKFDMHTGKCVSGDDFYRAKNFPVTVNDDGIFIGLPPKKW